ncbi:polyketide cyclase [Corallococcus sp. AB032C]|uniref:SRPBCC family protein n=1 Tax=Corallococcus TaxID=83461 RepID=UPI000EC44D01|nr:MULTISPECIES: SRPBCC family protein [Corallococcus]NNB88391.1 SRPBCC family protein [Corallococcus exiguus]NPC47429.1 SRPBCC family protein [Corallococcus exiguus]RKH78471.1 polyketide cyclase [Corallococcus sp. AB032C]
MFKKIAIGVVAVLALLAGFITTRPDSYTVTRTATVPGTPDVAFGLVHDFHQWNQWSPWDNLDPNMKKTFGGAESGVGATYGWVGNNDVGEGRMTILEATANAAVRIKLEFIKPFEDSSITTFTFKPADDGTTVTWAMAGNHNFMSKAMCLVMDMDQMIGKDFEKGLASMKTAAQTEATKRAEAEAARKVAEAKAAEEAAAAAKAAAPAEGAPAVAAPTP